MKCPPHPSSPSPFNRPVQCPCPISIGCSISTTREYEKQRGGTSQHDLRMRRRWRCCLLAACEGCGGWHLRCHTRTMSCCSIIEWYSFSFVRIPNKFTILRANSQTSLSSFPHPAGHSYLIDSHLWALLRRIFWKCSCWLSVRWNDFPADSGNR